VFYHTDSLAVGAEARVVGFVEFAAGSTPEVAGRACAQLCLKTVECAQAALSAVAGGDLLVDGARACTLYSLGDSAPPCPAVPEPVVTRSYSRIACVTCGTCLPCGSRA